MNRRAFNALVSGGAVGAAAGAWPKLNAEAGTRAEETASAPAKWPEGAYRRLLVDTHIPDWDPALLARFNASEYVATIANAGFQSLMQYAKSHVGLCLWQTKIGPLHANMRGRDYFGEVIEECRKRGLHTVAYYSLIFDIWAFDHFPDWRILPENGYESILQGRPGVVCPNSPYRTRALAELRELVGNYDFEGIFLDMTFWPYVCYCPHCAARFRDEQKAELPHLVNWDDPTWRAFQKARERWLLEFAMLVTKTIKDVRPITVTHQYSTIFSNWVFGVPLELRDACDFVGGDFYGGPTQYSLVCKAYDGLTARRPFEFYSSRTVNLNDFETTKPFNELLISSSVPTVHSAANLVIDSFSADGTINPEVYKFLANQNAQLAPFEPFLGGEMLTDVAVYYDKESMYDPAENGLRVSQVKDHAPHISGVTGLARILREAHIPYGVVTNVNLDKLDKYRAVMAPNVLEMTAEQAGRFREFVRQGGVLYASGPTSLDRFSPGGARFLLEDVLGVTYKGNLGTAWTYFSPQDGELKQAIWPQDALSFPGPMIRAEMLPGAQVLATATLPFVDPKVGNCVNVRFAQIWNNPPALSVGTDPAMVVHSFGQGKAIWLAAPLESGDHPVNAKAVRTLLRRVLPAPLHFEVDAHTSVEMTLILQADKRRLLACLLNMDWQLPPLQLNASVRVQLPAGRRPTAVLRLPKREAIPFRKAGSYVEFRLEPFETLAMALVEFA
jgi:hypothetical protein